MALVMDLPVPGHHQNHQERHEVDRVFHCFVGNLIGSPLLPLFLRVLEEVLNIPLLEILGSLSAELEVG